MALFLGRLSVVVGRRAVLLTLCGQLLARLWWPLELASHFVFYYFLALLPATILCLAKGPLRRWRVGWLCLAALLWNGWLLLPYFAPSQQVAPGSVTLRVMTLNVLTSNTSHDDVLRLVAQEDPDVLALLEVNDRWLSGLKPLSEQYPVSLKVPHEDNFGIALFAKHPSTQVEMLALGDAHLPSLVASVPTAGGRVAVLATHPLPPTSGRYAGLRNTQLQAVGQWAADQPGDAIVMGDLNITPWSPYFRSLVSTSPLRDSGLGHGYQPTWFPTLLPLGIPIDHVLHTQGLQVVERRIGAPVGSDHRAVVVDFALASAELRPATE